MNSGDSSKILYHLWTWTSKSWSGINQLFQMWKIFSLMFLNRNIELRCLWDYWIQKPCLASNRSMSGAWPDAWLFRVENLQINLGSKNLTLTLNLRFRVSANQILMIQLFGTFLRTWMNGRFRLTIALSPTLYLIVSTSQVKNINR